jgi:hypothetical protein
MSIGDESQNASGSLRKSRKLQPTLLIEPMRATHGQADISSTCHNPSEWRAIGPRYSRREFRVLPRSGMTDAECLIVRVNPAHATLLNHAEFFPLSIDGRLIHAQDSGSLGNGPGLRQHPADMLFLKFFQG